RLHSGKCVDGGELGRVTPSPSRSAMVGQVLHPQFSSSFFWFFGSLALQASRRSCRSPLGAPAGEARSSADVEALSRSLSLPGTQPKPRGPSRLPTRAHRHGALNAVGIRTDDGLKLLSSHAPPMAMSPASRTRGRVLTNTPSSEAKAPSTLSPAFQSS